MRKYCYLMTGSKHWFDAAVELYEKEIAKPVIWLGDNRHLERARQKFGDAVADMNDAVHYPWRLECGDYNGEYGDFFFSKEYLIAKDRCLKMLDRLDHLGMLSRLDREVYVKKVAIWALKRIHDTKPDALIMAESPHSHAQYMIFEIFRYLGIPVARFNSWTIAPLMFLQDMKSGEFVKKEKKLVSEIDDLVRQEVIDYIATIRKLNSDNDYQPEYMVTTKRNSGWLIRKIHSLKVDSLQLLLRDLKVNLKMKIDGEYYPINPFRINLIYRSVIKRRRRINLETELKRYADLNLNLSGKFVYFPLHYEPERTSNPDGEAFNDQMIALIALRKMLPLDVRIVVKEHPSQTYYGTKGILGRSPLFYRILNSINGVCLAATEVSSVSLIKKSLFTATITGTAAVESAILGKKALVFGETWFIDCPNTIKWRADLTYQEINNMQTYDENDIREYFLFRMETDSVIARQNPSREKIYPETIKWKFGESEVHGIVHLVTCFLNKSSAQS